MAFVPTYRSRHEDCKEDHFHCGAVYSGRVVFKSYRRARTRRVHGEERSDDVVAGESSRTSPISKKRVAMSRGCLPLFCSCNYSHDESMLSFTYSSKPQVRVRARARASKNALSSSPRLRRSTPMTCHCPSVVRLSIALSKLGQLRAMC